jgi:hypothetical protein
MSSAIAKMKRVMIAAGAATAMMMVVSTANAANCRSTIDEDGDSVVLCGGAMALYDADDDDDEDDSRGFVYDEDEGSLMVDLENCEPGKYWMMETDEADDVPLPCR